MKELEQAKEDIKFLLQFVPDWAKIVPEGLNDPTFYGTLSEEGDREVKKRVDEIRDRYKDT